MHTAPDMTDFLGHKTSTLNEFLSLLLLLWQPTTAQPANKPALPLYGPARAVLT